MPAKTTLKTLQRLRSERPIVCLTAYDAAFATLVDRAGVDILLVGDSLGNNVLGFTNTIPVTMDMMVHHTAAVARAKPSALVVADLPFGEVGRDFDALLCACRRLMQEGGAEAVKIEANDAFAPFLARLVEAGIPVWAHIGLRPQQVLTLGGYRKFGKSGSEREELLGDAHALEQAGAFALLGEMIEPAVAAEITSQTKVPFIGIGCGPRVDGQILTLHDVLGLGTGSYPSFSKQYARLGDQTVTAVKAYREEVIAGQYPPGKEEA